MNSESKAFYQQMSPAMRRSWRKQYYLQLGRIRERVPGSLPHRQPAYQRGVQLLECVMLEKGELQ